MANAVLFIPSEEAVDRSLDARKYVTRLGRRLQVETRPYRLAPGAPPIGADVESVAVLSGLSQLEVESGYMEMDLDTVFQPQHLLEKLRAALPTDFMVVAVVDDAFSQYLTSTYLKAGASAVVGTSGDMFGLVVARVRDWEHLYPYINVYRRV